MIHICSLLSLLLLCISMYGQHPVQVFTPNAASLGQYGQIPVNYFNGLPEISIPLSTFKAKGYELPISVSYHASGHRPDSHPGWVGLGWSLRAGGMINRIVNGYKDEKSEKEFQYLSNVSYGDIQSAYYYQAEEFQNINWSDEEMLRDFDSYSFSDRILGTEPDEFQISIDDIQASFYIVGNNKIKIKSKTNANFKASIKLDTSNTSLVLYKDIHEYNNLESELFTYISEIVITKDDGTKYYFGGDMNAIEFSCVQHPQFHCISNGSYINSGEWKSSGTANTWLLRKIELTNGEAINFEYEKRGTPIIVSDCHYAEIYALEGANRLDYMANTKQYPNQYQNIFFTFIQPSYLKSIRSAVTGNEILFQKSPTTELSYDISKPAFEFRVARFLEGNGMYDRNWSYEKLMAHNYYMQLDEMVEKNKRTQFRYSKDPDSRLRLLSIATCDNNGNEMGSYRMDYNKLRLPSYNSKKTDKWGYYNNRYYGNTDYEDLASYRIPDENYMQAEILMGITYPTGGRTEFVYEAHRHSQIAKQFDFEVVAGSGTAGGLRIKEIKNIEGGKSVTRTFEYTDSLGYSSGILSGNHLYYVTGRQHVKYHYSRWWGLVHTSGEVNYKADYYIMKEDNINQLSTTNGNHVTYSRIIEKLSDGSKTIYTYSNHDLYMDETPVQMLDNINNEVLTNAFISKELERGLLLKTEYLNSDGLPIRTETNRYNSSPERYDDFVKSANQVRLVGGNVRRVSALKLYTFYPYLESKTTTVYDPLSRNSLTTLEKYEYNAYKLPVKVSIVNSKGEEEVQLISYTGDLTYATFDAMKKLHMVNFPVEKTLMRNRHVVSSELSLYHRNELNGDYVSSEFYKAKIDRPLPYSQFVRFNGGLKDKHYDFPEMIYTRFDRHSNITEFVEKGMQPTTCLWSHNGEYPTGVFENARNDYEETSQYEDYRKHVNIPLSRSNEAQNLKTHEFYTSRSGIVEINMSGVLGWNWHISGRLDGKDFGLLSMRSRDEVGSPWTEYRSAYKDKVTLEVTEGFHRIQIMSTRVYKGSDAIEDDGSLQYSYWGQRKIDPIIKGHNEVLYINFENYHNADAPQFGFHSSKSYTGAYIVELPTRPDRDYRIDYRVYKDGEWHYRADDFKEGAYTINEGIHPIDDIRVYPDDASVSTYTYYPFVGVRSKTDGRGMTESYDYDRLGRLKSVKDADGYFIKTFEYKYHDQPEEAVSPIYYSVEQRNTFTKNDCDSLHGELGAQIEYVVLKAAHTSHVSQEDANRKAYDDLVANGQRYANENALCLPHIIVSVYNPFQTTYKLEFVSGSQGNMTYDLYLVPSGKKIADTGDVLKDYLPHKLYIPRRNYRNILLVQEGKPSEIVQLSIKSSECCSDLFYDIGYYDGYEDTYVIGEYTFVR